MVVDVLRVLAAVGSGLVAGLFFAFSVSVMAALRSLPAPDGAAAMRAINVAILNPLFLAVFVGTALLCVALVVAVAVTGGSAATAAGAGLYVVGAIGVTVVVHVPMNTALADSDALWERYVVRWTRWNHVRTLAAAAALVLLVVG
jgi:uncharacterized membrane protein